MSQIPSHCDTLLLDMDGTLLDLAFDNVFWLQIVPEAYASAASITLSEARDQLKLRIGKEIGTLNWYCTDYWSDELQMDIVAMKRAARELIGFLPGAETFLQRARNHGVRLVMVTNAHRDVLQVKDEVTQVTRYMDEIHSSHDFGAPKEAVEFWRRFTATSGHDRKRCLMLDDSLSVLEAARSFGLGAVIGIARPDSRHAARDMGEMPSVSGVDDLIF